MPRPSPSNEKILHNLRYDEEFCHRYIQEYFFKDRPLTLNLTRSSRIPRDQLEQVQLENIQDSCNKSTAIYFITPHFEPHTEEYCRDYRHREEMMYSIYEQWFQSHDIDIDFGNFVAKLICLKIPSDEHKITGEHIIIFHKAWCDHVETTLPLCSEEKNLTETSTEELIRNGMNGINKEQHMHYKLQPIFRALIMIIDDYASEKGTERVVHLVRTTLRSELSAPITFESLEPKFQHPFAGQIADIVVSTTLSAAIDFVMTLASREQTAFPERRRDPNVVDNRMGSSRSHNEKAISKGYTGPEIQGPSSGFVKLAEGEEVLPPITHLAFRQKTPR